MDQHSVHGSQSIPSGCVRQPDRQLRFLGSLLQNPFFRESKRNRMEHEYESEREPRSILQVPLGIDLYEDALMRNTILIVLGVLVILGAMVGGIAYANYDTTVKYVSMAVNHVKYLNDPAGTTVTELASGYKEGESGGVAPQSATPLPNVASDLEFVPRLLTPHFVDGFVGELDDMEFVECDLGVRKVLLDPRLERRPMSMLASVIASRSPPWASRKSANSFTVAASLPSAT